jgi:hypothetical protein
MNMDSELRAALRREPAPPDFAAKVLAKAGVAAPKDTTSPAAVISPVVEMKPRTTWLHRPFALAIAAALTAFAIIPAVVIEHQHREEARGLKARQDLLMALAITQDQFQQAREMIRRTTRSTQ